MPIQIEEKESSFHDAWASSTRPEEVAVRESFEAPTALETRFILSRMEREHGGLEGRRLLDVGCGLGESSTYFALRGAEVTATDISAGMLEATRRVARSHGVSVHTELCPAGSLPCEDASFDVVYVANTIHHLQDRDRFLDEVHRVLRPGGWFYSWDPLAYNPLINIYRRIATEVRTEDERPLGLDFLRGARSRFPGLRSRYFWIAGLSLFLKYYLIDRIDPNRERYWKRIYRETDRSLWWWKPCRALDAVLTRLPLIRRLAWNVVVWGQKED